MQVGGKRDGPIEAYPKFWSLNPFAKSTREILIIPAWKKSFDFLTKELETTLERVVFPVTIPEFPTVRRMTLVKSSPMLVPSIQTREAVEWQQKLFTHGWDPLFIGYSAAVCFHTCEIKINWWTTQAKNMKGSMPPRCEVRAVNRVLERAGFENQDPVYDNGRMIVEEAQLALKNEMKFSTRRHLAPLGLEEVELQHVGRKLDAAGAL